MECGQCRKQPERRQRQVDCEGERELRQHLPRRDAERRPLAQGRADDVDPELSRQCERENRHCAAGERRVGREHGEDEGRPEGEPRAADDDEHALDRNDAQRILRQLPEQPSDRDPDGELRRREHEHHLDDDELGRDRDRAADLELEP
jgi:hypothetical protein